ncbi:EAP30/Vps36 family-domain-containing protein [Dioszegia hungarica]|uniref:Vacuolar protein-sorting-associated protein 36 n=1 Tax=Dioszegia hungarica TaxID=4972 RepID=A0AA38LYU2_9TREE|nr:EAP30/Vps36 family-domain-containing protein [Dioszegia hungarica]KAI9639511.1 EAP30/Vps36 family-domain-containing protein [Dioszegia hungarica]
MRSSPKITISLGHAPGSSRANGSRTSLQLADAEEDLGWSCTVCGYRNGGEDAKCGLCGVGKDRIPHSRGGTPAPNRTSSDRPSTPQPNVSGGPGDGQAKGGKIACPTCTFLNHGSMISCEICASPLPRTTRANGAAAPSTSAVGGSTTPGDGKLEVVRLSFRKGGEKVAYAKLKNVLSQKAWERQDASDGRNGRDVDGGTSTPRVSGIDGIMQTITLDAKNRSANVSSAFADLEVLMVRAGEMVKLAQSLNEKLLSSQRTNPPIGSAEKAQQEKEATLIRTSLVQLGLPAPALTSDMVRSDHEYLEGLARELGALLTGHPGVKGKGREVEGLMVGSKGRGVIGLDEVWGLWMRARGVALLSPATLISILPFIPDQTSPPIRLRTLPSALKVLYSPTYSPPNMLARLLDLLSPGQDSGASISEEAPASPAMEKSLSLIEIAAYEGLAIGLAKELMEEIEKLENGDMGGVGGIVRDDQAEQGAGGVRWYRDIMTGWTLEQKA